jgi:hypothetical protein
LKHRKVGDEELCPICRYELYEGLETTDMSKLQEIHDKQMRQAAPIDVVIMSKCTDHCFHKECLEMQIGDKDNIRCAVCSQIYGILTGKMPPGEMRWRLTPKNNGFYCDGYENYGVWII